MNIGHYLRGEDRHIGTTRITSKPNSEQVNKATIDGVKMMNERIKELEKLSYVTIESQVRKGGCDNDHEPYEYVTLKKTVFSKEKFAELIIKECISEVHVVNLGILKGQSYYLDKVAEHLEKHFGVEE